MEERVNELLQEALRIMGEDSDIMIVSHKNGQCGTVIHGNLENNAKAVFSCIHQPDRQVGQALYYILKLNVMNLFSNPSPFGQDLVDSVNQMVNSMTKEIEEGENKHAHMSIVRSGDDEPVQ